MARAARITLWFTLAYLLAAFAAWYVLGLLVADVFSPDGVPEKILLAYVFPPFAAMAVFQLVFGLTTGIGRGLRYWLAAVPLTYLGAFAAAGLWIYWGQVWQVSMSVMIAITGGIGLWLALRSVRSGA